MTYVFTYDLTSFHGGTPICNENNVQVHRRKKSAEKEKNKSPKSLLPREELELSFQILAAYAFGTMTQMVVTFFNVFLLLTTVPV